VAPDPGFALSFSPTAIAVHNNADMPGQRLIHCRASNSHPSRYPHSMLFLSTKKRREGVCTALSISHGQSSDFHEFLFFRCQNFINLFDEQIGQLLRFFRGTAFIVFTDFFVFL